jgi:hypothetical protein
MLSNLQGALQMSPRTVISAPLISLFLTAILIEDAHAILIDDFTQGAVTLSDPVGPGNASDLKTGLDPAHALATARFVTFNALQIQTGATGQVTVQVDPSGGGCLRYSPDPGLTAANFFVEYGSTSVGEPTMSLNLLADGADRFSFDFVSSQGSSFFMDFLVTSANGAQAYIYKQFPVSSVPFTTGIVFSELLNSRPTLDLAHVTQIEFGTSNGNFRGSFALADVRTVPEPPGLAMATAAISISLLSRSRLAQRKTTPQPVESGGN